MKRIKTNQNEDVRQTSRQESSRAADLEDEGERRTYRPRTGVRQASTTGKTVRGQEKEVADSRESLPTFQKMGIPFSKDIMAELVKGDFRPPPLPKFEGKGDPIEHVMNFESIMMLYNFSDALNSRVFATTLTGRAQDWFRQLETESISSYQHLINKFQTHFVKFQTHLSKRGALNVLRFYQIRQKEDETLEEFMNRFHDEKLNVPNLPIEMITSILIQGLRPCSLLSSLVMDPPADICALYKEVGRCINEEDGIQMKQKNDRGSRR